MSEVQVTVSCNAHSSDELDAALDVVSGVFGVKAIPGERYELASDLPPFDVIVGVSAIIGSIASLYQAVGGPPVCKLLLDRLQQRFPGRKVQAQFALPSADGETILYHAFESTPNEALPAIAVDVGQKRDAVDPNHMRWWADGQWRTFDEYNTWLKRK